jgi:hypothetical protein
VGLPREKKAQTTETTETMETMETIEKGDRRLERYRRELVPSGDVAARPDRKAERNPAVRRCALPSVFEFDGNQWDFTFRREK